MCVFLLRENSDSYRNQPTIVSIIFNLQIINRSQDWLAQISKLREMQQQFKTITTREIFHKMRSKILILLILFTTDFNW